MRSRHPERQLLKGTNVGKGSTAGLAVSDRLAQDRRSRWPAEQLTLAACPVAGHELTYQPRRRTSGIGRQRRSDRVVAARITARDRSRAARVADSIDRPRSLGVTAEDEEVATWVIALSDRTEACFSDRPSGVDRRIVRPCADHRVRLRQLVAYTGLPSPGNGSQRVGVGRVRAKRSPTREAALEGPFSLAVPPVTGHETRSRQGCPSVSLLRSATGTEADVRLGDRAPVDLDVGASIGNRRPSSS